MPRYKVIGAAPVDGHAPGETFESNSEDVGFWLAIGAVKKVDSIEEEIKRANIESYKRK